MERNTRAEIVVVLAIALCINYGMFRYFTDRSNAHEVVEEQSTPGCSGTACDGFTQRSVKSTDRNGFGIPVDWSTQVMSDGYTMTIGTYQNWIVGFELARSGNVVLRDYTPPGEYITFVDPVRRDPLAPQTYTYLTGSYQRPLMSFIQRSIYDHKLAEYEQYEFAEEGPLLSTATISR